MTAAQQPSWISRSTAFVREALREQRARDPLVEEVQVELGQAGECECDDAADAEDRELHPRALQPERLARRSSALAPRDQHHPQQAKRQRRQERLAIPSQALTSSSLLVLLQHWPSRAKPHACQPGRSLRCLMARAGTWRREHQTCLRSKSW